MTTASLPSDTVRSSREDALSSKEARRVIVGMSGGVDSSVTALLLLQQGYQVEGLFMKNWDEDDGTEYCTAMADLADAQAVSDTLGIKLHTANFAAEYWDNVFEHFLAEYQAGRTPNPDILCNREIKFKVFLDYAERLGADLIATGHYVRRGIDDASGQAQLLKGLDGNKDQSYFLHAVPGDAIARTLFPVGELEKPEVRALAERHGLATARKKDSTGICFIGERRFSDFLRQYLPAQPGPIETAEGDRVGEHMGLMYYTLGQRRGLGIGGLKDHSEDPWFVAAKDLERNVLVVVQGEHPLLYSDVVYCEPATWVAGKPPASTRLRAKTRYRQQDVPCEVTLLAEGELEVRFDRPQRAVTPGQSLVLYEGDICLGGAVIRATATAEAAAGAAVADTLSDAATLNATTGSQRSA
ncbi:MULTISPECIES: tRNA 2-thiouridine(34) synthase MnmA [Salinicola]|uniref:tRNA 2-thiouridine(34) synthase MnmA n=1 Tax=Salinicola TaxID=404432 RepID=UPI000A4F2F2F|nr:MULTISPECIES: tRNA 2-thiouridine(34) synthase MnmA [Salinicola]